MTCCLLAMAALGPGIALLGWLRQMLGGASRATCCPAGATRRRSRTALAVAAMALIVPAAPALADYASDAWLAHQSHFRQAVGQFEAELKASRCKAVPASGEASTRVSHRSVALLSHHPAKEQRDQ